MQSKLLRTGTKLGLCTGALVAVGVMAAASASAATTYTVKAGTATSGTAKVTGKTQDLGTGGNQIVFVDTTRGQTLGCASGGAKGAANLGTAIGAGSIGTIKSTTWTSCKGPNQIPLTPVQNGTWKIVATGKTSGGITPAAVSGVNATVSGTGCSFTVTGAATGSYNNDTGVLSLAPVAAPTDKQKLTVSGVSGCFTAIQNGDNVTFRADYKLTTATGGLVVTSNPKA